MNDIFNLCTYIDPSMFELKEVPPVPQGPKTSKLTALLSEVYEQKSNPFFQYCRFDGEACSCVHIMYVYTVFYVQKFCVCCMLVCTVYVCLCKMCMVDTVRTYVCAHVCNLCI